MLYNIDGKDVTRIPHRQQYDKCRAILSDEDYYRAVDAINKYINTKDVFISSYIPGPDWTNTPYHPLYLACQQNADRAGLFFGQIVWDTVMKREDDWCFLPADKDFDDVIGMKYFRKTDDARG